MVSWKKLKSIASDQEGESLDDQRCRAYCNEHQKKPTELS